MRCLCCGDKQPVPLYSVGQIVLHPESPKRYMKIKKVTWSYCEQEWFYVFSTDTTEYRKTLSESEIQLKEGE